MVGFHAKKAGAVLYVHKFSKVAVHIANSSYCTEEAPVIMDNSTKIKIYESHHSSSLPKLYTNIL